MNLLSDFVAVQSRIELLFTIIFLIASMYFPFLLFVKKNFSDRERRLVRLMFLCFTLITVILWMRLITHLHFPEKDFVHGALLTLISLIIITAPLRKYIYSKMELGVSSVNFSLIKIIVASLFYTLFIVVYHFIGQLPAYVEIAFTLLFTLFFLTETVQIVMKIGAKLTSSTQSDWDGVERIKYGLFLLFAEIFLSLLLIICVFIKLDYIYIWSIICILTAFNGYIFIAPFYLENSDVREDDETGIAIKRDIYVKDKGGRTLNDRLRADDLYERLIIYFDQKKPYLRQNLKIKEVALYLYSNKTYLSRIINDKHNLNFNQFVNYYRIEEVKRIFAENSSLNIQELCTRSGFGSMATFSIAFRYYLGNTPADWCKEQKLLREHEQ
ncbi:MAG: helix-turn-helix domain-containing protein [Bacteroidales bacterium]|nr:helix-turn-helix domain-containing protein [Bacteroidales bacterium]